MRELFAQALTIIFSRGLIRLSSLISFLILVRFLTLEEVGAYGVLTSAISLAGAIGPLGFRQAAAYMIGRRTMQDGAVIGTVLLVALPLALVCTAAVELSVRHAMPDWGASGAVAIFVAVASTLFTALAQGVFLGRGEIRSFSTVDTSPRVALMVLTGLLAISGFLTYGTAVWSLAVSLALGVVLAFIFMVRGASPIRCTFHHIPRMVRHGLIFSLSVFLTSFSSRISVFILRSQLDTAVAGQYFAAIRIFEIVLDSAVAFGLVLFSHAIRSDDPKKSMENVAQISSWIFWAFFAGGIVAALLLPIVIVPAFGSGYAATATAIQVLMVGLGPAAMTKIIYPALSGGGRPVLCAAIIASGLLLNAAITWPLASMLGATAGAIGLVVGQLVNVVGYAIAVQLCFDVPALRFFVPRRADAALIVRAAAKRWHGVVACPTPAAQPNLKQDE